MPILVRPVREQFEHDRIIRLLQAKYRRKHDVAVNLGTEQTTSVAVGAAQLFPDLVLYSQERGHRLQGTVEVETGESVNSLEAMAQWGPLSKLRAPFFLYVPPTSIDTVRRLCADHHIQVAEIWTYHVVADQVRFTMVHRSQEAIDAAAKAAAAEKPEKPEKADKPVAASKAAAGPAGTPKAAPKAAARPSTRPPAKPAKPAKPAARPAAKVAAKAAAKPAMRPANNGKAAAARPPARKSASAKPAARAAKPAARPGKR